MQGAKTVRLVFLLATLMLLLAPAAAQAACTVTATPVAFGTYDPTATAPTDANGTVKVTGDAAGCGAPTIKLGRSGGSYNPRVFTAGPTTTFAFHLYSDAGHTIVWGDGTASTSIVTGAAIGANGTQSFIVYGRIDAKQTVTPGTYSAPIAVTNSVASGTISPVTGLTFTVATIVATCSISATPLAFGNYTGAQNDKTATLTINCTNTTPYNVGLSAGTSTGSTESARKMTGAAGVYLNYKLTSVSPTGANWGNVVPTTTVAGTGTGIAQGLTVYGRVAAGQYVAPRLYTDTVTATITY
jgi:spore coat protein U-like protein